ncbi:bacterio-opsin activator domain-containing protein [Natrialbaceae archaeon GCM10025810]|uniref:bacterio-opsin activator domain-containing protein n=1 Tax=Halovalidus salilacus TaxID=3075124 RepID=UPI003621EDBD
MSEGSATPIGDVVRVLAVGDSDRLDAVETAVTAHLEAGSTLRASTATEALDVLESRTVHCVVCDAGDGDRRGDGPGATAIVEAIVRADESLPIIGLADGPAAERALDAGATDVIGDGDADEVIARRVKNAADRYRLAARPDDGWHRALLEGSDATVLLVDPRGEVSYASPSTAARLGTTPDELARTPLTRIVHPNDRSTFREAFSDVASSTLAERRRARLRLRRADGTWRVFSATIENRLSDPALEGVVLTLGEADDGRAPPDRDGGLRAAIDGLEHAFFVLGSKWQFREANPAAGRLFDRPPDDLAGVVFWNLLPESVVSEFRERLYEARSTGSLVEFDLDYPRIDGRLTVYAHAFGDEADESDGDVREPDAPEEGGVAVYAVETSEADAPTALRRRLERFEDVLDALEDGVCVLEGETIEFANATLFELADADFLRGRRLDSLFGDELADVIRARARSPAFTWAEPVAGTLAAGQERRPVEVFVTPLSAERTLCVVRDERRTATVGVPTLHRSIDRLLAAESPGAVRERAVDAVSARVDADLLCWLDPDDSSGDWLPTAVETPESLPRPDLRPFDPSGSALQEYAAGGSPTILDRSSVEPALERLGVDAERVLVVPVAERGVVVATAAAPGAFESIDLDPLETVGSLAGVALDRFDCESALGACRRDRSRVKADLERLRERTRGICDLERALLEPGSTARATIERTLCEGLAALEWVDLAWIGDASLEIDEVVPRTAAGRDEEYLDAVAVALEADAAAPTGRAAATRSTVVVDDVGRVETPTEWSRTTLERGFRSVAAVPIEHGDVIYGTLTVCAADPAAFDEETTGLLSHLGRIAGYALAATETRRSLLAETPRELEVRCSPDDPLLSLVGGSRRRLAVQAAVPRATDGSTVYCTVSSDGRPGDSADEGDEGSVDDERADPFESIGPADSDDARAPVEGLESIGRITDESGRRSYELAFSRPTVVDRLAEHGGRVRVVAPDGHRVRLTIELPRSADVRAVVDALERSYSGTELVARRERVPSGPPPRSFVDELRDRLTERQLRTLEATFYAGYFEWPRERTGEEIARALGVSQPTFTRHLRTAERKLFTLLFEEYRSTVE